MYVDKKTIPAGAFKQGCLALLDEVASKHVEIIITKRGEPVARLTPIESPRSREAAILAKLRGQARMLVDEDELLKPSEELAGWSTL